jgi:hypothetical protein
MNWSDIGLGVVTGLIAPFCPVLAVTIVAARAYEEYDKYETSKRIDKVMRSMIEQDHPGLRSIVGDDKMNAARKLDR